MDPIAPNLSVSGAAPAATDGARAMIEAQLSMLSRLAEIGMEIAEGCGRDAKAEPKSAQAVGLVFARVARAVRMTIALQSRLMKDLEALDRADDIAAMRRKDDHRIRLSRLVGQAVEEQVCARRKGADAFGDDEARIEDEIERVSDEAYERLTEAEDGHLFGLSFDEAVAAICKDLGLSPDWSARIHAAAQPPLPVLLGPASGRTRGPSRANLDEPPFKGGSCWVPGPPPRIREGSPEDDDGEAASSDLSPNCLRTVPDG